MSKLYILFENASGYALFERLQSDELAGQSDQLQASLQDMQHFSKIAKLVSFIPFPSAEAALQNINDVSEGILNELLKNFLQINLPKVKSGKSSFILGVAEEKLGSAIQESLNIPCEKNALILELIRGLRLHFSKFIRELKDGDVEKAQLGLGHSYSRAKVKFNVNRVDNMIIQSISLLDQLDKDVNTFSMRCREWYSWHFPELSKIVADHGKYAKLVKLIKNKESLSEELLPQIEAIMGDSASAQSILEASRASMGTDISPVDMINIERFADRVIELDQYREHLRDYLKSKMHQVAPNLSALIGEQVGARLISHAGSLTNLAKCPASTVQILGAEKALFRALKTKGKTPKYGLIFHSTFIGRASQKNKGRISRYLANKCSIAARIDSFSDFSTEKFGEKLREQVEERLSFYDSGETPRKNIDVMKEVLAEVEKDGLTVESRKRKETDSMETETTESPKKKKKKAKKGEPQQAEEETAETTVETPKKKKKKAKKEEPQQAEETAETTVETPKKKKKAKKAEETEAMEVVAEETSATPQSEKKKKKKKSKQE